MSPTTPFSCTSCQRQFVSQNALQMHLTTAKVHIKAGNAASRGKCCVSFLTLYTMRASNVQYANVTCHICKKNFQSKNDLRKHKRMSQKHKARLLSADELKNLTLNTNPTSSEDSVGGVLLPSATESSSRDTGGISPWSDSSVPLTPATQSTQTQKPKRSKKKQEKAAEGNKGQPEVAQLPVAPPGFVFEGYLEMSIVEKNAASTKSGSTVATAMTELLSPISAAVKQKGKENDIKTDTMTKAIEVPAELQDGWSSVPSSEREHLLDALRQQCHLVECLSNERYWIRQPTMSDLDMKGKCTNCGVIKGKLDDPSSSTCRFHPSRAAFQKGILRGRGKPSPKTRCLNCNTFGGKGCIELPRHAFIPPDAKLANMKETPAHNPAARKAVVLDCEMVSVLGTNHQETSEVVTLSVVDFLTGETILNTFVDPGKRVLSWRSKISGVTPPLLLKMKKEGRVLPGWRAARDALWRVIDSQTVLVGHSLNFDLDVLGMVHTRVVDSAILTRDAVGADCRRFWGLKSLVREFIGREVQSGKGGHDGLEDTFATREVVLWCLRNPGELEGWAAVQREGLEKEREERIFMYLATVT
ncbi:hypothetical protein BJY04DRAFT_210883 [Aspergillus karnatakaensis]|uniref:uncharacterized protein n=1 Tax=Aspergillus karnatakaensis TaxID=1810916 RepID=UPI003CCD428F